MILLVKEYTLDSASSIWERFLRDEGRYAALLDAANSWPDVRSITVSYREITRYDPEMAEYLLARPKQAVYAAEQAMVDLLPASRKAPIRFRVAGIANLDSLSSPAVGQIRPPHLGKLLAVRGTVRKVTAVLPKIREAVWQCVRCGAAIEVSVDGQELNEPLECYEDQGGCKRPGRSTKFILLTNAAALREPFDEPREGRTLRFSEMTDFQLIEIQEPTDHLRGGEEPQRLRIYLEEDLTGLVLPGETITVNGTLREKQGGRQSAVFEYHMEALSIERDERGGKDVELSPAHENEARELAATPNLVERLVASIAPALYGLEVEKKALLLQLFGGVTKQLPDGTRIRGDIHGILCGDPGLAKSQLLRYMAMLAPRAMYGSGKSASAAGLTAALVHEDDGIGSQRWALEAGLLVLADLGLACVDEFDKMNEKDRDAMHQALEQQVVTVNKAGVNASLMARCAVLAAANPRLGRFDRYESNKLDDVDLPPPILSRFDFVILVFDKQNKDRDRDMAIHVTGAHRYGEILAAGGAPPPAAARYAPPIPVDKLRRYIAFARRSCNPVLTGEAERAIQTYYVDLRARGAQEGAVPATPRQLDGYVRLAEAAARMELSPTVEVHHVELAEQLLETFLRRITGADGPLDIDAVTVGTTTKQREIQRTITDEIAKVPGGLTDNELEQACLSYGITENKTRENVEKMSRNGQIYKPPDGRWRVANRG